MFVHIVRVVLSVSYVFSTNRAIPTPPPPKFSSSENFVPSLPRGIETQMHCCYILRCANESIFAPRICLRKSWRKSPRKMEIWGTTDNVISLGNRSSRSATGEHTFYELSVLQNRHAIDKHKFNSLGILQWLFIRRLVDDAFRIEYSDIGIRTHANSSFVLEHRSVLLQPLRRHQRHFPQGGHQVERLFFADVMPKNAREGSLPTGMNPRSRDRHSVAGDHDDRIRDGCARGLFRNRMNHHNSALLPVLLKCFCGQAFPRCRPLQILVSDRHAFLPTRIKNCGFQSRARRGVGIALRRPVDAVE